MRKYTHKYAVFDGYWLDDSGFRTAFQTLYCQLNRIHLYDTNRIDF